MRRADMTVKLLLANGLRKAAQRIDHRNPQRVGEPRDCPICGYHGAFEPFGVIPRPDAMCPNCNALERHRQFKLMLDRVDLPRPGSSLLHFAPEAAITRLVRPLCDKYVTADLMRDDVDLNLDIEAIDLPDRSFDCVICSHVLEHVNDIAALKELYRILKPGGIALLMVPIVEGWETSYEDSTVTDERDRLLHFGQRDHVRRYGRDFRDRVRQAGFELSEFVVGGADSVKYSIIPGIRIFIAGKPAEKHAV
jgi:SAM-dependent methyltransferase